MLALHLPRFYEILNIAALFPLINKASNGFDFEDGSLLSFHLIN
jgi:hypothetical protein